MGKFIRMVLTVIAYLLVAWCQQLGYIDFGIYGAIGIWSKQSRFGPFPERNPKSLQPNLALLTAIRSIDSTNKSVHFNSEVKQGTR
jgi:hypothetical protein